MELWMNQVTNQVIYAEVGRICYDPTWRYLGLSHGTMNDLEFIKQFNGWFGI